MKTAFWKADWFFGLVIAIVVFGFSRMSGFVPGIERWAYDQGVQMTSKPPSDKVAVIAIDDTSLANIGRWPWPREVQAQLIDQLSAAKAKVIGNTVFFFEPQRDPGLGYVEKMTELYAKAYPSGEPNPEVGEIGKLLAEASVALNSDVRLSASMKKAGNVLVPVLFEGISAQPQPGKADKPLPPYVSSSAIEASASSLPISPTGPPGPSAATAAGVWPPMGEAPCVSGAAGG